VTYPPETLHEIVTNAVLHPDYSTAADIQIRVFDNRVEVESPGVLPGQVTVENMLDEQFRSEWSSRPTDQQVSESAQQRRRRGLEHGFAFLNRCQAEVRLGRRGKRRSIERMRLTAASFGDGLERPSSRWRAALEPRAPWPSPAHPCAPAPQPPCSCRSRDAGLLDLARRDLHDRHGVRGNIGRALLALRSFRHSLPLSITRSRPTL